MNRLHCFALSCLALTATGVHAIAPESVWSPADGHETRRQSDTPRTPAFDAYAWSDPAIDATLDELDLLDPDLGDDQLLELLDGMFADGDAPAQPMGGPSAGYVAHRKWGGSNGFVLDRFAGTESGIFRARAAARLDNGDVVVVGDVQGDNVASVRNLGMVKYNSRGQRVRWTGVPSQFAHSNQNYILYPGTDSWGASRTVTAVHDVKVRGSNIYVLFSFLESGQRRAGITRWSSNGGAGGWWFVTPDGGVNREAVAMDIYGDHMIVLGRRTFSIDDADGGFWTFRATINADGGLTIGAITTIRSGIRMLPADVAFARSSLIAPVAAPAYYVVDSVHTATAGATATWPCIHRITSNNVLDPNFGTNGFRCNPFAAPDNSDVRDWAAAVHTSPQLFFNDGNPVIREVLYMSTVYWRPADGIGLVKLVAGAPDTSFGGTQGQRYYGGCDEGSGEGCRPGVFPDTAHVPLRGSLFADGSGVYVSGRTFTPSILPDSPPSRRPIFMHVNASNGDLTSLQSFSTYPNSRFGALVPGKTSAGQREFTVAGYAHYQDTDAVDDGPTRFLSAHLVRDSDLIFYDGMQSQSD